MDQEKGTSFGDYVFTTAAAIACVAAAAFFIWVGAAIARSTTEPHGAHDASAGSHAVGDEQPTAGH